MRVACVESKSIWPTCAPSNRLRDILTKAEKERDMHKWNSEKLVLEAKMTELNQSLKAKDEESTRREFRMRKKHKEELDQVEEGYNDQFDEMQGELNRLKTANTYLENNQHQLKLE